MANTDKNLVITPNTGSSADDPKIVFSGADATTTAQDITLKVYPTSNGTLSFEGSAGQLFSITNDLSGTIFSVNDVSGIPSIEVVDDGTVKIAEYSGNLLIGTSTDDNTNKVQVDGSIAATSFVGPLTGNASTATALATARSIGLSGDVSGSVNFDGSANATITAVVADDSHNHSSSSGNFTVNGNLFVGSSSDADSNVIEFAGTTGDAASLTYIGERIYESTEKSELLLFKGNDIEGVSGSDRIRLFGNNIVFDVFSAVTSGTFDQVGASANAVRAMTIGQTGNVSINNDLTVSGSIIGNAATASKLAIARSIGLSGDVSGSVNFDGSANATITAVVADDSHNHVISNVDGLQTALDGKLSTTGKAADSDKLDGLDSSQFLRSDTNTTAYARITLDTPSDYDATAVTSLTNAPLYVPEVHVGSTPSFLPFLHQTALHSGGYRTHMNLGLYKNTSGWGENETGFYVALGGSDSYPTEYFRMTYGGNIKHSRGYVFYHTGNDGAGSGLDADLLDGVQLAAITRSGSTVTLTGDVTGSATVSATGSISIATTSSGGGITTGKAIAMAIVFG